MGFAYLSFGIEAAVGNPPSSRMAGTLLLIINFRWPSRRATAAAFFFFKTRVYIRIDLDCIVPYLTLVKSGISQILYGEIAYVWGAKRTVR
jgi:hypothetical protein